VLLITARLLSWLLDFEGKETPGGCDDADEISRTWTKAKVNNVAIGGF